MGKHFNIIISRKIEEGVSCKDSPLDGYGKYIEYEDALLGADEYPNIYSVIDYKNNTVSEEEFYKAIDIIITGCMQQQLNRISVDLDKRNGTDEKKEIKEMTISQIEEMLGCKLKIVNDETK